MTSRRARHPRLDPFFATLHLRTLRQVGRLCGLVCTARVAARRCPSRPQGLSMGPLPVPRLLVSSSLAGLWCCRIDRVGCSACCAGSSMMSFVSSAIPPSSASSMVDQSSHSPSSDTLTAMGTFRGCGRASRGSSLTILCPSWVSETSNESPRASINPDVATIARAAGRTLFP